MKCAILMLAAMALLLGGAGQARAGFVTDILTANPSTIPEGGSTNLTNTLSYTPSNNLSYSSGSWGYQNLGFVGDGYISGVALTLYSGDGQTTIPIHSISSTDSVAYASAGTYTASVSGYVTTADYYEDYGDNIEYVYTYVYLEGYQWIREDNYYNNSYWVYNTIDVYASTPVYVDPSAVPHPPPSPCSASALSVWSATDGDGDDGISL